MSVFFFVVAMMVTHNLALMASKETGPFRIFERFRAFLKRKAKSNEAVRKSAIQEGIECFWCMSRYAAALVVASFYFIEDFPPWLLPVYWLALSTGSIIINQAFTKG